MTQVVARTHRSRTSLSPRLAKETTLILERGTLADEAPLDILESIIGLALFYFGYLVGLGLEVALSGGENRGSVNLGQV